MKIRIVAYERVRYDQIVDIPEGSVDQDKIKSMLDSGNTEGVEDYCSTIVDTSNIDDGYGLEDVEVTVLENP